MAEHDSFVHDRIDTRKEQTNSLQIICCWLQHTRQLLACHLGKLSEENPEMKTHTKELH